MSSEAKPNIAVRVWKLDAEGFSKNTITALRIGFAAIGTLALVVGAFLAFWPSRTIEVVAVIMGIYLLVSGVMKALSGMVTPQLEGSRRALLIVLGVLYAICGLIMVRQMFFAGTALAVFVGITVGLMWIIEGVTTLTQGDFRQSESKSKAWTIVYAVISIVAGAAICFSPAWGTMMLMVFAGAALIVMGGISIYRAFTFGRDQLAAQADAAAAPAAAQAASPSPAPGE